MKQVTFLYGPNGSGKSSIAKGLRAAQEHGLTQELFDKDFVDRLLLPDQRIPGVFVIRDGDPDIQQRIDELAGKQPDGGRRQPGEIEYAANVVDGLEKSIEKQKRLVNEADSRLSVACWEKRKKLPRPMQQAFKGFLGDSGKNLAEVHRVRASPSPEGLKNSEELLAIYATLESENTKELQRLQKLPNLNELSAEQIDLLTQPIKSKDETNFGDFVRQVGNSDWVRQGLHYLEASRNRCPFCQQSIDADIEASLVSLFDHFYEDQVSVVRGILKSEEGVSAEIDEFLTTIRTSTAEEAPGILKATEPLMQQITLRIEQVKRKIEAPSSEVDLQGFGTLQAEINKLISDANERIDASNQLLRNKQLALESLKAEVWQYYVHSVVDNDLAEYDGAINAPIKALANLEPKLSDARNKLTQKRNELSGLQRRLTSAVPTVEAINRTLLNLGFLSFSIQHIDNDDTYKLVRPDGTPASQTLSEGERTLISLLYYFHKLMRIHEDQSAPGRVVAVIDDPVSSLDGEMLFVINLLLRKIFKSCVDGTGRLEQVFLLTHNAYFFKESEFTPKGISPGDRSFFVLTKGADGRTTYKHYEQSPIKSNYTQLWNQVRAASKSENPEMSAWLPNAMRRIIENYFQIAGGLDTDKVIARIPESDRWACQALLSWYNDGSHTSPWDIDYSSISSDATTHIRAFQRVFEASGHAAHYEMMMAE
ncbi:AAA family ATPase [Brevibacterium antiquum]|uniref:AAA family ATPase n=1 Tax=Brevibacterium antiquum TaxID=234835 RepID=UPI0015E14AD5|nr:AAA family ATPase [Brevibacterium antiquum]